MSAPPPHLTELRAALDREERRATELRERRERIQRLISLGLGILLRVGEAAIESVSDDLPADANDALRELFSRAGQNVREL